MEDFLTAFCPKLPEFGLNSPKLGRNGGQTSAYIPKMGACRKSGRNTNPIPGSNPQLSGRLGHHADPPPWSPQTDHPGVPGPPTTLAPTLKGFPYIPPCLPAHVGIGSDKAGGQTRQFAPSRTFLWRVTFVKRLPGCNPLT